MSLFDVLWIAGCFTTMGVYSPLVPFSSPLWLPPLQYWLNRRSSPVWRLVALLLVPIPGILVLITHEALLLVLFDDVVTRATLVRELRGDMAWSALALFWYVTAVDLILWGAIAFLCKRRRNVPSPTSKRSNRHLVYGVPALMILSGWFADYLHDYRSLGDAVREGDFKLVERRLRFNIEGAGLYDAYLMEKTSIISTSHEPLLDIAFETGDKNMIVFLLNHGVSKDWSFGSNTGNPPPKWLAIAYPIGFRSADLVEFMLDQGSNPNARDSDGYTPLHIAAISNAPNVIDVLIRRGADPAARTKEGRTPLDLARDKHCLMAIDALIRHRIAASPFLSAVEKGNLDVCRAMIQNGQDLNEGAPLHIALKSTPEMLDLLLASGADPLAFDENTRTQTAMHAAARTDLIEHMRVFLRHRVPLEIQDKFGRTPLMAAAEAGKLEMVDFLCDAGADVNAVALCKLTGRPEAEYWGETPPVPIAEETPLLAAIRERDTHNHAIMRSLLERGADPNRSSRARPLAWAVLGHDLPCVQMLLDRGAEFRSRTRREEKSPTLIEELAEYYTADTQERSETQPTLIAIAKELVEHGADSADLCKATEIAEDRQNTELAAYLRSVIPKATTKPTATTSSATAAQ